MRHVFGEFALDDIGLWRNETQVSLGPTALRILRCFVESPQTVISNTHFYLAVWGRGELEERCLTNQIHDLRVVLGDVRKPYRIVQNVRGEGYIFLLPVHVEPSG